MQNENIEKEICIAFVGSSKVGKTSIFDRFCGEKFEKDKKETQAVKMVEIIKPFPYKDKNYKITIIDTPGSDEENDKYKYPSLEYCKLAQGVFLTFNLTNQNSLNEINFWINKILEYNSKSKLIILGNKCDAKKIMSKDFIKNKLQEYGADNIKYLVTSAKKGKNIEQAFKTMIDLIEGNADKCCKCCPCW